MRNPIRPSAISPRALPLCLLLLAVPALAQQAAGIAGSPTANVSPSVSDVQKMISKGQLKEAEAQLDSLAKAVPEPEGVERLRGMIFYQRNDFPAAEAAFGKAMVRDHGDLEATQMRGVTLYRLGKPAEAIPFLERSNTTIASNNADGTYVLAACYLDVRRYEDARKIFAKQYKVASDSGAAYLFVARMLLRRNFPVESEQLARKALALDPHLPLAHLLLGQIALGRSQQDAALLEFEAEKKINPMDGQVYERLGDSYLQASRFDDAQQALDCAILLEPNSTGPYILLGQVMLKRNDAATAINYLARAEKMDPANHLTHLLLGQAYRAAGRKDDATREYKSAESIQNSGADAN